MVSSINHLLFDYEQKQSLIRAKRAAAGGGTSVAPALETPQPGKTHKFSASVSGEKIVEQSPPGSRAAGEAAPDRSLKAYLALPVEQYSLLDPKWITRDDQRPGVFLLKVPLLDLVGVDLTPQLRIAVDIDASAGKVQFVADGFKLGEPRFDRSDFKLEMKSRLSHGAVSVAPMDRLRGLWRKPPATTAVVTSALPTAQQGVEAAKAADAVESLSSSSSTDSKSTSMSSFSAATAPAAGRGADSVTPAAPASSAGSAAVASPEVAVVSTDSSSSVNTSIGISGDVNPDTSHADGAGPSQAPATSTITTGTPSPLSPQLLALASTSSRTAPSLGGPPAKLCCSVSVSLTFTVPHPLSIVPGPLLTATGSLIARIAMQRMLPSFLDLLAVDYGRWASGGAAARGASAGSLIATPEATPVASLE